MRQVFSDEQETALMRYLLKTADMYYGLSTRDVRNLAFAFATKMETPMPKSWLSNRMAGIDWLLAFMKRHPILSLRKPQPTSLGRATSFNRHNVQMFYDNLAKIMDELKVLPQNIWNFDESGITTVHKAGRIVARCGVKQVGDMTSGKRGVLVTIALAISASGASLPPFYIYPCVRFKPQFLNGAAPGTIGYANGSGWMKGETFLLYMQHFQSCVRASKEHPVLLLLDNHESHLYMPALDFCVENGIHIVSFPPHCTHKLQPLDRTVFGPFKTAFARSAKAWMRNHPGRVMKYHDLAEVSAQPLQQAVTPINATSGFRVTGIYPFNADLFTDLDFAPSSVTDRPFVPTVDGGNANAEHADGDMDVALNVEIEDALVDTEIPEGVATLPETITLDETLETIVPFPKAPPRVASNRGRKKRKTAILTSEEVMVTLRAEQLASATKKDMVKQRAEARAAGGGRRRGRGRGDGSGGTVVKPTTSGLRRGRPKKQPARPLMVDSSDTESDEETVDMCCVCAKPLPDSENNKICGKCVGSACEKCATNEPFFVCVNCDSADDGDSSEHESMSD